MVDIAALIERTYDLSDAQIDEAGRIVSVRVVPYRRAVVVRDQAVERDNPEFGTSPRPYREGWELGAFRHAVKAPHRVPFVVGVAGGHQARRTNPWADVGRTVGMVERDDGLYADLLVDRTSQGDTALYKINSGQWRGISVGAVALAYRDEGDPYHGGTRWRTRGALDHILLTEVPAYPESEVLAVREGEDFPRLTHWRARYPGKSLLHATV